VIAVVGAGAIGGLLAAELVALGHEVTVCARRPLSRLVVERDAAPRDVSVTAVTSPDDAAAADWVLVALKAHHSAGAAPWLEALRGPRTVVVGVQNGVEHRENLGADVVPALAYTAVERVSDGVLRHSSGDRLVVPAAASGFAALFDGSALQVELADDFLTAAWRKLLANLAGNAITTLTLRRAGALRGGGLRELARGLLLEGVAVGRAEGAALSDEDVARTLAFYDALPPDTGSSMLFDRLAGRPLEHQGLTGAVVRAAGRHGLDVPLNHAVLALLEGLDGAA
jgi:2-dehydropantoate 2-reductase